MALIFNPYSKGAGGFLANLRTSTIGPGYTSNLYFYPSTVSMPTTASTSVPAGSILSFSTIASNITLSGNSIAYTGTARSAAATAAGTISWFFIQGASSGLAASQAGFVCDSISLSGGGGVAILSALTVTSGQSVTWSGFNLTMV